MKRFLFTILLAVGCCASLRAQTQNFAIMTETLSTERMDWNSSTRSWDFFKNNDERIDAWLWRFEINSEAETANISAAPVNRNEVYNFRTTSIDFSESETMVSMVLKGIDLGNGNPLTIMVTRPKDDADQSRHVSIFDERARLVMFFFVGN